MTDDVAARTALAEQAARAGGTIAQETFRQGIDIETKSGKTDVVTKADRDVQRAVAATIREEYPNDTVVGEEEGERGIVPDEGAAWIVDPIDGTNNYVRGTRVWATSVAAVVDGEPVAAVNALPAMGDVYASGSDGATLNGERVATSGHTDPETMTVAPTFWWERGRRVEYAAACREIVERFADLRRYGCAQGTLSMVASGALDGAVTNLRANPWDTVAGVHMIRQAGGHVTDLDGERWRHDSDGLVASNGAAHGEVLSAARAIERRT